MTPVEQAAYRRGRVAFRKGKTLIDNPFHCATEASARKLRAWKKGFEDAGAGRNELTTNTALDAALKHLLQQ